MKIRSDNMIAIEKNPVKARVFNKLFFRHWDEWVEDKRQHLLVVAAAGGDPLDITPGDRDANPTSTTFSVGDDFAFSPDGTFLLYTAVPAKNEAWSTNYEICRVSVNGGEVRAKVIGEGANLGCTQLGRIEYARAGGRMNTDAIDNSAGVDTSDHEVNLKILLGGPQRRGELTEMRIGV